METLHVAFVDIDVDYTRRRIPSAAHNIHGTYKYSETLPCFFGCHLEVKTNCHCLLWRGEKKNKNKKSEYNCLTNAAGNVVITYLHTTGPTYLASLHGTSCITECTNRLLAIQFLSFELCPAPHSTFHFHFWPERSLVLSSRSLLLTSTTGCYLNRKQIIQLKPSLIIPPTRHPHNNLRLGLTTLAAATRPFNLQSNSFIDHFARLVRQCFSSRRPITVPVKLPTVYYYFARGVDLRDFEWSIPPSIFHQDLVSSKSETMDQSVFRITKVRLSTYRIIPSPGTRNHVHHARAAIPAYAELTVVNDRS